MAYISFGQCLKQILADRNYSVAQLQRKLGYKSATTITRILHDNSSVQMAERLLQQLLLTNFLALRRDEITALEEALHASIDQLDSVSSVFQKLDTIFVAPAPQADTYLQEIMPSGIQWHTLSESIKNLEDATRVDGILLGNFLPVAIQTLASFCSTLPQGAVHIRHFLEMETSLQELANVTLSLHSIFPHPWYEAYISSDEKKQGGGVSAFARDMAVFCVETKQGTIITYEICRLDENELYVWKHAGTRLPYVARDNIVASSKKFHRFYPFRKEVMANHDLSDILSLYRRSYFMERNRIQRIIRQTICVSHIQPDIMLDHVHEFLGAPSPKNQDIVTAFMELHTSQYENHFTKKCPTYMILSKEGMRRFAREGRLTDHPHGFSPFSVSERSVILREFIENCQSNPYYHVYMANDSFRFGNNNYTGYNNFGLYVIDAATDYDTSKSVHEALISNNGFLRMYERYFDEKLLRLHVDSQADSLTYLKGLLSKI